MYTKAISAGGHEMLPSPASSSSAAEPNNYQVASLIQNADKTNVDVASLWGIQQWSNTYVQKRIIIENPVSGDPVIGSTGIGEWQDSDSGWTYTDESTTWGWYHDDALAIEYTPCPLDDTSSVNPASAGFYEYDSSTHTYSATSDSSVPSGGKTYYVHNTNTDDVDIKFLFDPSTGESVVLGGYEWDTETGYICIKFASSISDTTNIKIAVDIKYTRTNVG